MAVVAASVVAEDGLIWLDAASTAVPVVRWVSLAWLPANRQSTDSR